MFTVSGVTGISSVLDATPLQRVLDSGHILSIIPNILIDR